MNRLKLIHAALFTPISRGRWGLPLLFRGPPGGGKTTTFRSVALSSGLPDACGASGRSAASWK